jgi:hypothetical protein
MFFCFVTKKSQKQIFKVTAKSPGPKVRSLDHLLHRQRKAAKKFRKKIAKKNKFASNHDAENFEEKFRQIKEHIALASNKFKAKHMGQNSNNHSENGSIIQEYEQKESRDSLSGQNTTVRKLKPPILDIGEYQQFTLQMAVEITTTTTTTNTTTTSISITTTTTQETSTTSTDYDT